MEKLGNTWCIYHTPHQNRQVEHHRHESVLEAEVVVLIHRGGSGHEGQEFVLQTVDVGFSARRPARNQITATGWDSGGGE